MSQNGAVTKSVNIVIDQPTKKFVENASKTNDVLNAEVTRQEHPTITTAADYQQRQHSNSVPQSELIAGSSDSTANTNNNNHFPMMEESKNQTEYKRSFVWSKPMVEMPPPKAEPLISNYQISYGSQLTVKATAAAAAAGASSGHSSLDHLDHHHPHHSHQPSKSVSSAESRSPTPGIARTLRAQDVASAISGGNALTKADNTQQQQQQQHSSPNHAEQMGHGPAVLFSYEPPPRSLSPIDIPKQSEYHAKFKPFDEYVYVEGEGKFKKQTPATKLVAASTSASANGVTSPPPASASKAWFVEVEERCKQACKYRARSQNGATPINPDHPWDGVAVKDRNLAALALATRLIVEEKKQERKSRSSSAKPTSRSSQARHQLNSAPASLRDQHSVDSSTKSAPKPVPRKLPGKAASPVTTTDKNNNVGPAKPPMAPKKAPVTTTTTTSVPKDKEAKVWLKPAKKAAPPAASAKSNGEPPAKPTGKAVPKAVPKAGAKASAAAAAPTNETPPTSKVFDSEPKSVPLRTTQVKSPEELTGIKSPSPESWKVSIEKGGLNWVNGNTPVNFDGSKTTGAPGLVKPVPINGSIK